MPDRSSSFSPRAGGLRLLAAAMLSLVLVACGTFSDAPPVPKPTFVQVMAEMHLVAARYSTQNTLPPGLRDSVLARYDVSQTAFDATLSYYVAHPEAYQDVYTSIIDTLSAISVRIRQNEGHASTRRQPKVDSLRFGR